MPGSKPASSGRIYLSYRRGEIGDTPFWCVVLYNELAARFGEERISKDIEIIQPGEDFVQAITREVESCEILLALIGKGYLDTRRLDDPNDFVRLEIEAALKSNIQIIAILVDGAKMPAAETLPPNLSRLAELQPLKLNLTQISSGIESLSRALESSLPHFEPSFEAEMAAERAGPQQGQAEWMLVSPEPPNSDLDSKSESNNSLNQDQRLADENVQFSVYRPRSLEAEKWHTVLAFAHLAEPREPDSRDPVAEVRRQAEALLGPEAASYRDTIQDAYTGVLRGSGLTMQLDLPGCDVNPPDRWFLWEEDVHREEFRVQAPPELAGQTLHGTLTVYVGGVLLADVPLAIPVGSVGSSADAAGEPIRREAARPYRRVFASYSHLDGEVVQQVERLSSLLGDTYLRDVSTLRSGEVWDSRLLEMIEDADVFQLFWSSNAMRSPSVRKEYEHALSLNRPAFVRPTYWERPFPEDPSMGLPPPQLRSLHFQPLPLEGWPPAKAVGSSYQELPDGVPNDQWYPEPEPYAEPVLARPPSVSPEHAAAAAPATGNRCWSTWIRVGVGAAGVAVAIGAGILMLNFLR